MVRLRVRVNIRFCVWSVSGYAHARIYTIFRRYCHSSSWGGY